MSQSRNPFLDDFPPPVSSPKIQTGGSFGARRFPGRCLNCEAEVSLDARRCRPCYRKAVSGGHPLHLAREEAKESFAQLAGRTGLSLRTVKHVAAYGEAWPSTLLRIAQAWSVPLRVLVAANLEGANLRLDVPPLEGIVPEVEEAPEALLARWEGSTRALVRAAGVSFSVVYAARKGARLYVTSWAKLAGPLELHPVVLVASAALQEAKG